MADFLQAFNLTIGNEGGYVNDSNDSGGETYCGISRKNFPNWPGWAIVDAHQLKHGNTLPELLPHVQDFYKENFWDKMNGDDLTNQVLAANTFDYGVKDGIKTSIKSTQTALGIPATGIMDELTIQTING